MTRMPGSPTLVVSLEVETTRYGLGVESAVYLFVLECLTNAMKHADDGGAGRAGGPGRWPRRNRHRPRPGAARRGRFGTGLAGLHDRLAAVGGRLEVDSGVGGTRLRGFVPVVQHA